jgi:hypothetical protein
VRPADFHRQVVEEEEVVVTVGGGVGGGWGCVEAVCNIQTCVAMYCLEAWEEQAHALVSELYLRNQALLLHHAEGTFATPRRLLGEGAWLW